MSKSKSTNNVQNNLFINKDDLRDYIHSIHDDLRNSGAGYGQTGLKIFSVFYGLKLIKPNLNKLKLSDEQKKTLDWDEIVRRAKLDDEIIEYIDTKVLEVLFQLKEQYKNKKDRNAELGHFIFHQIPRDLKDKVWKDLILKIDKIPVGYNEDGQVNLSGKVWEYFVGRDKTAISELGAFFTDRPITDFCFNKVKPKLKSDKSVPTMIDIFGGSGGFTLGYANYMRNKYEDIEWKNNVDNIYHFDMEESVVNMTGLEMFAITGFFPKRGNNFLRQNSFKEEIEGHDGIEKYDYVFSNPPYGGDKNIKTANDIKRDKIIGYIKNLKDDKTDKIKKQLEKLLKDKKQEEANKKQENTVNLKTCSKRIQNFAKKYEIDNANDKEACSLILLMDLLDKDGVCCGVLKEGVFFDGKYSKLRKVLLENYNVTHIISIPSNAFENTTTKTSIILFHNKGKTVKIEFSELIVHNIQKDEFKIGENGEVELRKTKDEFDYIEEKKVCVASMKDIIENKTKGKCMYSLNMKDYKEYKVNCPDGYEMKKLGDVCEFNSKSKRLADFANQTGKYRYYSSGQKILNCDIADFKNELSIIIGHSGDGCIFIDDVFSTLVTNHVIQTDNKYITLYLYDYIKHFWNKFYDKCYKGSTVKNTSNDEIEKFPIPFPKNIDKLKPQLDKLYKLHQDIMSQTESIPVKEKAICEIIKKATDEGKKGVDYEEYKLDENICKFKGGAHGNYSITDYYTNEKKFGNIRIQDLNDNIITKIQYITEEGYNKCKNYNIKTGDILLSDVSEKTFVKIVPNEWNNFIHGGSVIRCYDIKINNKLLYYFFKSDDFNFKRQNKETGSVQKHLTQNILNNMVINIPTEKQMKKLKLQELFDEVDELKETLEKNKQIYQDKMKELFKDFEDEDSSDKSNDSSESNSESEEEIKPKKKVKAKKQESSCESCESSESSSSESEEELKSKRKLKNKKVSTSESSESESNSSESEEEIKPKKKVKPVNKSK